MAKKIELHSGIWKLINSRDSVHRFHRIKSNEEKIIKKLVDSTLNSFYRADIQEPLRVSLSSCKPCLLFLNYYVILFYLPRTSRLSLYVLIFIGNRVSSFSRLATNMLKVRDNNNSSVVSCTTLHIVVHVIYNRQ